ncbi:MAG: hypothetical protein WCK49_09365 [Myxococcaceae bacterium]
MKIVNVIKQFYLWVGPKPACDADGSLSEVAVCSKTKRKRYSFAELMEGATLESIEALNAETAWSLEGTAIGRELL